MATRKKHLINVHTGTGTTAPTNASLYLGEIAVQHTPNNPALWIKMGTDESSNVYEKFIGKTEIINYLDAKGNAKMFYGTCSTAAATFAKTVDCSAFTQADLVKGALIYVTFSYTNSAAVGSLTMDVNETGAKPIKKQYNTTGSSNLASASELVADSTYLFQYNGTNWVCMTLDYNTTYNYYNTYYGQSLPLGGQTGRYRLLFTSADGQSWVPANTANTTNATSARDVNQTPIDPFGSIVYYNSSSILAAGTIPGSAVLYNMTNSVTLGYSFNRTGAALSLTVGDPVYVKGEMQGDGSAIIDSGTPFVQSLPNSEDGKIYIFIGYASAATAINFTPNHPVYEYKNGHVRIYQEDNNTLGPSYTYSGLPYVTSATSIADAYSALTNELFKDEEVISAAFNDLNDRIDNIHVDMILGSGYTYSGIPYVNSATTLADAYSALTQEVIDDEEVTSEALNDLNDRIIEISGNVANIHVDMILGSGYTYSGIPYVNSATTIADAYSALTNEVILDELVFASAVNDLNDRVDTKVETIVGDSGMLPNVVYELGTVGGAVSFELVPPTKTSIVNHYYWTFDTGTLTPTVTWPSGISKWAGNCVQNGSPVLVANAHYEVSVMDGYAFIVGV